MNLKPVIYFVAAAILVVITVGYGQYQLENGRQEGRMEALRAGYDTGFQEGQLNP